MCYIVCTISHIHTHTHTSRNHEVRFDVHTNVCVCEQITTNTELLLLLFYSLNQTKFVVGRILLIFIFCFFPHFIFAACNLSPPLEWHVFFVIYILMVIWWKIRLQLAERPTNQRINQPTTKMSLDNFSQMLCGVEVGHLNMYAYTVDFVFIASEPKTAKTQILF